MKKYGKVVCKKNLPYGKCPMQWSKAEKEAHVFRHYMLMQDSIALLQNTFSEDTFRNRYEAAIREAQIVISICGKNGIGIRARRMLNFLLNEREQILNDFTERCTVALVEKKFDGVYVA